MATQGGGVVWPHYCEARQDRSDCPIPRVQDWLHPHRKNWSLSELEGCANEYLALARPSGTRVCTPE